MMPRVFSESSELSGLGPPLETPWPRCIFCNVHDGRTVLDVQGIQIVTCGRCGHCYSTFVQDTEYAGYFGDEIPDKTLQLHRVYWGDARMRAHDQVLALLGVNGKRLLDVGCGLGYFVQRAQAAGAEAYGCELSPVAVRYAQDRLGLRTVQLGALEHLGYRRGSFDVITLWDVIEHLRDPFPVIRCAASLLRPSGVLFIQTPNVGFSLPFARMKRRLSVGSPDLMEPRDHMNNFSRETLTELLARAGLGRVTYRVLAPVDGVGLHRGISLILVKRAYVGVASALFAVSRGRVLVSNTLHALAHPQ
jgi:2-polyprenyl-3-methyl-5-hydroxy-6-metoxy-1,4-benzoquinol methylase